MNDAVSQNLVSQSSRVGNEKKYWLEQLAGRISKTGFPEDLGGDSQNQENVEYGFIVAGGLYQDLLTLVNRSRQNLFVVLAAVVNILLHKYTGRDDVITVSPIYAQSKEGDFINTILPLRLRMESGWSFKDLLKEMKQVVVAANKNANYPVERLLANRELDVEAPDAPFPLSGVGVMLAGIHKREYIDHVPLDMLFQFSQAGEDKLEAVIAYRSNYYLESTIAALASRLELVLAACLKNPGIPLSDVNITTDQDRAHLETVMAGGGSHDSTPALVHELLAQRASQAAGNDAVVFEGKRITYSEMDRWANCLAEVLQERGVGPGTIVAVFSESSLEFVVGMLAVLKAGGAYLPITPELPPARVAFILKDAACPVALTRKRAEGALVPAEYQGDTVYIDLDDMELYDPAKQAFNLKKQVKPGDPAYTIYTSGTTGTPKGVLVSHANLVHYIRWFLAMGDVTAADHSLLLSSFSFDLGYSAFFPVLAAGGQFHMVPRDASMDMGNLLNYIKEEQITYMKLTPSLFSLLINDPSFTPETFAALRMVVLGGEAIIGQDARKLMESCPHVRVINHYGPTEATVGCVAHPLRLEELDDFLRRPVIGKPIFDTRAYVLNSRRDMLPAGIPGELTVSGAGIALGYLNRPELTAEKFKTDSLVAGERMYGTGDRARYLDNGTIEFLGRMDKQVKIRGYRIELAEIQRCLVTHELVNEAVCMAESGSLIAFFTAEREIQTQDLKDFMASFLPVYMIPAHLAQLDSIPLTPNGKVDEFELRKLTAAFSVQADYEAPQGKVEEKLAAIWQEVLGFERVGRNDSYFDLGGDSIKSIRVISAIFQAFDLRMSIADLYEAVTMRQLAQDIAEHLDSRFKDVDRIEYEQAYRNALQEVERLKKTVMTDQ